MQNIASIKSYAYKNNYLHSFLYSLFDDVFVKLCFFLYLFFSEIFSTQINLKYICINYYRIVNTYTQSGQNANQNEHDDERIAPL